MKILNKIENIFVTRSFISIRRIVEKEREKMQKEISVLSEQMLNSVRQIVKEVVDETVKKNHLSAKKFHAVSSFLRRYYEKKHLGDYKTHFVSYYYEAPCGVANLGDYIQTIATEAAIREYCANTGHEVIFESVLRSSLTDHSGGTCVMQGWYEHQQLTFLPGPDTRPVWIGTHLCADTRKLVKCLYDSSSIRFSDVGCRDRSTMAFFQTLGTTAYFSRCLTLTLPRRNDLESQNADTIYLVDCFDEMMDYLPEFIKKGAKRISQRNYPFNDWKDWRQCREAAVSLLDEYRKHAKLVVTTALHCAQPCMAMGIPVVFIKPGYNEEDRFSSMDGLITLYSFEDLKKGRIRFDVKALFFEDLKSALLRNLALSLKESLSDKEVQEKINIRTFIEQYKILD